MNISNRITALEDMVSRTLPAQGSDPRQAVRRIYELADKIRKAFPHLDPDTAYQCWKETIGTHFRAYSSDVADWWDKQHGIDTAGLTIHDIYRKYSLTAQVPQ